MSTTCALCSSKQSLLGSRLIYYWTKLHFPQAAMLFIDLLFFFKWVDEQREANLLKWVLRFISKYLLSSPSEMLKSFLVTSSSTSPLAIRDMPFIASSSHHPTYRCPSGKRGVNVMVVVQKCVALVSFYCGYQSRDWHYLQVPLSGW